MHCGRYTGQWHTSFQSRAEVRAQLGNKDPSSALCVRAVIKVSCPCAMQGTHQTVGREVGQISWLDYKIIEEGTYATPSSGGPDPDWGQGVPLPYSLTMINETSWESLRQRWAQTKTPDTNIPVLGELGSQSILIVPDEPHLLMLNPACKLPGALANFPPDLCDLDPSR